MVSLSYKWKWWTEMFCAFIFGYIGIILLPSNARHTQSVNEICIEIPLTIANFSGSSFSMPIFVSFSLNVLLFTSIIQLFKFYWIYFLFRWKWIFFFCIVAIPISTETRTKKRTSSSAFQIEILLYIACGSSIKA